MMKIFLVTSNLIERSGKFLLIQEGHPYAYGLWNFPAGKVEEGITLTKNAVKEAKEETGFKVKVKGFVGVYQEIRKERNVVIFVFNSKITGGRMHSKFPSDEIIQAQWFTYEQVKRLQLRSRYILTAINDYRKRDALPLSIINSKIPGFRSDKR